MRKFKLEEVLSAISGIVLCEVDNIYKVLDFVTGKDLIITAIPSAIEQCKPVIEDQHPFLKEIDLTGINSDNWKERLDAIKEKYPNEIELIPANEWRSAQPINKEDKQWNLPGQPRIKRS
jgi:hypothetical protein